MNLDPSQVASVVVDLYAPEGGRPVSINMPALEPNGMNAVYLPAQGNLPDGTYAAVVHSDRAVAAVGHTAWGETGAAVVGNPAELATELLVPSVMLRSGGFSTVLVVQNADTSAAVTAQLDLLAQSQTTPQLTLELEVPPGSPMILDFATDDRLSSLTSFYGWARITAPTPVTAWSMAEAVGLPGGAYAVEAVPAERLATKYHAPMVFNAWGPERTTSAIGLLNPGNETITATVRYDGVGGTCLGQTSADARGPLVLPPGGMTTAFQGELPRPPGNLGLSEGCAATATIDATGALMASAVIASDPKAPPGQSAGYAAQPVTAAAPRLALPVWRKSFYGTSEIHIANPGADPATVTLTLFDGQAGWEPVNCGPACTATIPAGGGQRFDLAEMGAVPLRRYGWAMLTADYPILATLLDREANAASLATDYVAYVGPRRGARRAWVAVRALPAEQRRHHHPAHAAAHGHAQPDRHTPAPPGLGLRPDRQQRHRWR